MTCERCDGDRWIEHDPDTWKPCPACNTDAHAKWASGTWDNHRWTRQPDTDHTPDPNIRRWFGELRDWLTEPHRRNSR